MPADDRGPDRPGGRVPPRALRPPPPAEPRLIRRMLAGLRGPDEGEPNEPAAPPPPDAQAWIKRLGLRAHPEGGFHRETYRAPEQLTGAGLPEPSEGPVALCSASYVLLEGQQRWLVHRLTSHQVWYFLDGDPLVLYLFESQELRRITLGRAADAGQALHAVVPASTWFGAALAEGSAFALVGGTFTPGLDPAGFERGERRALLERYPRHQGAIKRLTR